MFDRHGNAWRAIATGLIIAIAGPLLGYAAVVGWTAWDYGPVATRNIINFSDLILLPYMIGGPPAAIAGLVAGWRIWRDGWITLGFWLAATLVALAPSLYFLEWREPASFKIMYISDQELAALYIMATLFASAVLRLTLVLTGLMRKAA
jgi:hypothetical protein